MKGDLIIYKGKDLTGQRFGRLIAIKRIENNNYGRTQWLCQCDCGNEKIVITKLLLNGECKSCGCLKLNNPQAKHKRLNNKYKIIDDYAIIFTSDNKEILVDKNDLENLIKYYWSVIDSRSGYAYCWMNDKLNVLHKFLINYDDDMVIDHIDRNKLNNRRDNLRIVYQDINSKNSGIHKNNTSTVSGVNQRKDNNKWVARIGDKMNRIYLGQFDTFEEAVDARYQAEIELNYINENNYYNKNTI